MTFNQNEYYQKNKEKIMQKQKERRAFYKEYNKLYNVDPRKIGRCGYAWKGKKIKCMNVKKEKVIVRFD